MSHSCKEHGEVAFCDSCLIEAQQAEIAKLKDELATHKIEHFEMYGRVSYALSRFLTADRDPFYEEIKAILCGRLRHPELSFDRKRVKALRGEHE